MLTAKTIFGAVWSVSSRLSGRLIDVATLLILARILTPEDFGLTALAISVIALLEMVMEIPLIAALTRLPTLERRHLDTAFTLALLRGLALALIVAIIAYPLAMAYDQPRLAPIIMVLSLAPVARGLLSPAMAHYVREIKFKRDFAAQVGGKLIATAGALGMVWAGFGYWAIIANHVISATATSILTYILAPYRPRFSLHHFKAFSEFLGWFTASQMVSAVNWQLDRLLLGGVVKPATLGKYAMGSDISNLPTQAIIGPAMFPVIAAFSQVKDDTTRLSAGFLKACKLGMLFAAPIAAFVALYADQVVALLLDEQWTDVGVYLQLLALVMIPAAIQQPLQSLSIAMDRTRVLAELNSAELVMKLIGIPLGIYLYSIWGVIAVRNLIAFIMLGMCFWNARRLVGVSFGAQVTNLKEVLMATLALAIGVFGVSQIEMVSHWHAFFQLAAAGTVGGLLYLATLRLMGMRLDTFIGSRG